MDVLVALVAASESRTKSEAAGKLKLCISALDKRLRAASSLYGVPLVRQSGERLALTEEGQIFCSAASQSVDFASLAEESLRTHLLLKTQHLLLGHSSYLPPPVLAMIHRLTLDGNLRVEIDHRPGLTRDIARAVRNGELHAGFGFLPLTVPDLVIRKVWDDPLAVCIPSHHTLAARTVIRPEDLHGQPFIAVSREPMPGMHEEMEEHLQSMGVMRKIVADAFAPMEALNLVEQQVGLCILSESSAVPHRGVTVRPLWTRTLKRQSVFFHREDNGSALVAELTRIVLEQARQLSRATKPSSNGPAETRS